MMTNAEVIYNGKFDSGYTIKMYDIEHPIKNNTNTLMSIFLCCIVGELLLSIFMKDDTTQVNSGIIINPPPV